MAATALDRAGIKTTFFIALTLALASVSATAQPLPALDYRLQAAMAYNRGVIAGNNGEHDRAVAEFTEAIRLDPQNINAYYGRGFTYHNRMRDYDRAIADYTRVLQLDPRRLGAHRDRASAHYAKGRYQNAVYDYELELRLNPDCPVSREWLANSRKLLGRAAQTAARHPQIVIVNNTGYGVWRVHLSPAENNFWGHDRLTGERAVENGQSVSLDLPQPISRADTYHIKLQDINGREYVKNNVLITAGIKIEFDNADAVRPSSQFGDDIFTDSRDGKRYRTVRIGNKTWMAGNLDYGTGNSRCYGNNASNCAAYGRLYDWNTARNACPAGWRLPTNADWSALLGAAGGENTAGTRLKSRNGWIAEPGVPSGADNFGFFALPGGIHINNLGFAGIGDTGRWWSATTNESGENAFFMGMDYNYQHVFSGNIDKKNSFSVRCVRE